MAQQKDLSEEFKPILIWLSNHFNPQRFFIFLSTILFLIAWNRGIALLYGMVSLVLAILAASYLLPRFQIRKVSLSIPTLLQCPSGEKLKIDIQLNSPTPCQHLSISIKQLFHQQEDEPAFIPYMNGHASACQILLCSQRGNYEIDQLIVSSNFPFGIYNISRNVSCSPSRLLVYPRTFAIRSLPLLDSQCTSIHGHQIINRPHTDEEYAGVREYRHGDNLKHIHWGASARHQELIVREFESYDLPAILIIINSTTKDELGQAPNSSFEYSIEIAASLMLFSSKHGIAVELFAEGQQGFHLSLSPGEQVLDYQLSQFARMKADGSQDYWQQVTSFCSRFPNIDSIVTFSTDKEQEKSNLHGKNHLDIRFEPESFHRPGLNIKPAKPLQKGKQIIYKIQCGNRLDGLFDEGY